MADEVKEWSVCGEWKGEHDGLVLRQVCPALPPAFSCADCGEWCHLLCDSPHAITWQCVGCQTRWRYRDVRPLSRNLAGLWPEGWLVWTVGRDWRVKV